MPFVALFIIVLSQKHVQVIRPVKVGAIKTDIGTVSPSPRGQFWFSNGNEYLSTTPDDYANFKFRGREVQQIDANRLAVQDDLGVAFRTLRPAKQVKFFRGAMLLPRHSNSVCYLFRNSVYEITGRFSRRKIFSNPQLARILVRSRLDNPVLDFSRDRGLLVRNAGSVLLVKSRTLFRLPDPSQEIEEAAFGWHGKLLLARLAEPFKNGLRWILELDPKSRRTRKLLEYPEIDHLQYFSHKGIGVISSDGTLIFFNSHGAIATATQDDSDIMCLSETRGGIVFGVRSGNVYLAPWPKKPDERKIGESLYG